MTQYAVGWIGLALINAALANVDRRNPGKYFLGSLILGPIVTMILAATREERGGALRQVVPGKEREETWPNGLTTLSSRRLRLSRRWLGRAGDARCGSFAGRGCRTDRTTRMTRSGS